jgi:hypothetical protein
MARNCLNSQPALGSGTAGTTSCSNCDQSYYFTVIGESTYDVPNAAAITFYKIDDGIEPMEHTITYDGKIVVEFTGNVKRLIAGPGTYENCFIGVAINGNIIPSSVIAIATFNVDDQYDVSLQAVPFDVVTGDVITIVAGTVDVTVPKIHRILNHNMRVIYLEVN